jgi:hypothetical protein
VSFAPVVLHGRPEPADPSRDPEEMSTVRIAPSVFEQDRHRPCFQMSRTCGSRPPMAASSRLRSRPVSLMMHFAHMASLTRMRATAPLSRLPSRGSNTGLPFAEEWPQAPQLLEHAVIQGEDKRRRKQATEPPHAALAPRV